MTSITEQFLVPVSTVSARNAWHDDPPFVYKIRQDPEGVLPENLGEGVRHASWNPYPISDQNLWFSLPYFRPEALEPCAWPERVTSCYGTYTVGVNIIWGNGLIAKWWRSSFFEKTYPIQDFGAAHIYIAYIRLYPRGRKTRYRLWVSLLTQAWLIRYL